VLPQLAANGLISASVYVLMAVGFATIYRTARFFHFAHAVVYTV
jgi:branched-chain amino acid transport system permease protein